MTQWILTSSVLILLVIAVRGLFKEKMKAKYTYALWLLVLVRLLCPVNFGELSFNLLTLAEEGKAQVEERMEEREEEQSSQQVMQEFGETVYLDNGKAVTVLPYYPGEVSYEVSEQVSAVETAEDNTTEAVPVAKDSGFQFPEIHWQKVLPVVWAVGMVVIALVIVSVNISFSTMLGLFRKELPTFTRKGRGSQKLSVYLADGIYSSCLYGVVRPSIYLNRKGMGEQEKKYCIEHEYSHYLQGDMVWSVCRIVCLILHWYNPLVWLAVTLSKKDAELACDERTIERLGEEERYSYGHTLVELAANQSKAVQMFGMATLMASDKKEVVNRVKAITTKKQTKIITGLLVVCLLVGIGCFVFTGVAKGEQENNNKEVPVATETPVPTVQVTPLAQVSETPAVPTPYTSVAGMMSADPENPYVYVKTGKNTFKKEYGIDIRDEVEYQEISVQDVLTLEPQKGQGWKLDLDGDGTKERMYVDELRGIYINDVLTMWMNFDDTYKFCFLDIDTTDGMYEFLIDNKVYYYDGDTVQECAFFTRQVWMSGTTFTSGLNEFERVDEHTISFATYHSGHHCIIDMKWKLNEEHKLVVVEEGSSFDFNHKHETREMYTSWKGESTTVVQDFREVLSKEYVDFTFTDHVKLTADAETGWRIDLNGDGVKEEICIYKKEDVLPYLCINGYGVIALNQLFACCWLLDIDTTDGMYEILTDEGGLMVYDGEKLNMPWVLKYYTFGDGCTFHGTLAEFKRVDEHTISYVDIVQKEFLYYEMKEIQARLDSNHALYRLEQAGGEETVIAEFDSKYEYPGEPFRLYSEKDETSSYVEIKALPDSEIISLTDDGSNWFYVTTRDNGSGWILYGEHDRIDSFLQQMADTTAEDWEDSRWYQN